MEYTNDIICKVKYIGESQKLKKNLWTRIKENRIITIVTIVFAIFLIADVVLLSNFIKIKIDYILLTLLILAKEQLYSYNI